MYLFSQGFIFVLSLNRIYFSGLKVLELKLKQLRSLLQKTIPRSNLRLWMVSRRSTREQFQMLQRYNEIVFEIIVQSKTIFRFTSSWLLPKISVLPQENWLQPWKLSDILFWKSTRRRLIRCTSTRHSPLCGDQLLHHPHHWQFQWYHENHHNPYQKSTSLIQDQDQWSHCW